MVDICRLCASLRKIEFLVVVNNDSNEICDKILKCCQLSIQMDDALPKSICHECILNLNNSHKFYTKVHESQETLQALYPYKDKFTHILQRTLSPEKENQEDQNVTIDESKEEIEPGNHKLKQILTSVNELKMNEEESEQINEGLEEINICEKTIYEDSLKILDEPEDKLEDFEKFEVNVQSERNQFSEETEIYKNDVHYAFNNSKGECLQSNEVIDQIVELSSDDEFNIEIEYLEDEEHEVEFDEDAEETFENKTKNNLITPHEISSWKNYKFLCFICDDIFTSFMDLKTHISHEHNIKKLEKLRYKCYDCKKIIPLYSFFLNHVRASHHPDLKLKCDACDLSCQNFKELTHHRRDNCAEVHNYVEITTCTKCFKSFNNAYGLQNHIKFQHNSSSKAIFKCMLCDKEFQYKSCLKAHALLHTEIKDFSCDYCGKSFYTKLGLEQHLYVHVEVKSYVCNICKKSYKTFNSLNDHRKLHTKEKSFNCQFCSKTFSRKIQKITHERSHTGEKPYSCERCDKKFRHRSALFVHNKIHTGSKPYLCEYCEKTFADSSNRNKHVRRMHINEKMKETNSE